MTVIAFFRTFGVTLQTACMACVLKEFQLFQSIFPEIYHWLILHGTMMAAHIYVFHRSMSLVYLFGTQEDTAL
jgi:hypothetical protein